MVRGWAVGAQWVGVALACSLLGCPQMNKAGHDAGSDASPSGSVTPEAAAAPATAAANDSDVTKYPDQNPDNMTALTVRYPATARTEASTTGGKVVAPLKAGTEADEIADHDGFDLVLFTDPSDATRKIEGWASHTVFVAEAHGGSVTPTPVVTSDAGPPKPSPSRPLDVKKSANGTCPGGYASCGAMCRATCKADADCGLSTAHCVSSFCLGPGAQPCGH